MNLTGILAMLCAFTVAVCALVWNRYQTADARADKAEAALVVEKANQKVVTRYVDKIVTVERRIPGAVTHIRSLCDSPVPGTGDPDGATAATARDQEIARLARDFVACVQNAEQLSALQEVLRRQVSP